MGRLVSLLFSFGVRRLGVDCILDLQKNVMGEPLARIRNKRKYHEGGIYNGKGFDGRECVCREGREL